MAGAKDRDTGETNAMLYEGASISQLVRLFEMDARDVSKKLRNVTPCGERRGFPIYKVRDAAKALMPPETNEDSILEYIANMNFKNLPPALNKEVWNGLRARLRFEQEQGDLWATGAVSEVVNKLMQTFRMGVLLLPDRINRTEGLTTKQREAIEALADQFLADMQQQVGKAMDELPQFTAGIMDYGGGEDDGNSTEQDGVSEVEQEDFDL